MSAGVSPLVVVCAGGGGFLMFRFRRTNYSKETGPGCIMAFAILLTMTGLLAALFSFIVRV